MFKLILLGALLCKLLSGFEDVEFIKTYFSIKSINMITFFICVEDPKYIMQEFITAGYRVSVQNMLQETVFDVESLDFYHQGFVVDPSCAGVETLLDKAARSNKFTDLELWLFIEDDNLPGDENATAESCEEAISALGAAVLSKGAVFLHSQVVWAQRASCDPTAVYALFDVYRISAALAANSSLIGMYRRGGVAPGTGLETALGRPPSVGDRRRNLHGTLLRAGYVIQFQKNFTFMEDLHKRGIESFLKRSYPQMVILMDDLNFRANISITNSFGWDNNASGTFDGGLMGQFQKNEIDFSMQSILMRKDRLLVSDFTAELVQVEARVIFRQPPLSSLSNIFVLPFNLSVWLSCGGLCVLTAAIIIVQFWFGRKMDEAPAEDVTVLDVFTLITGAICQQGFSGSASTLSTRVSLLLVFISSLFLFTSYSANIVALLQTPSTSIKTLKDLIESPLGVGIQNITYNVVFITESKHAITRRLYERKVLPKGDRGFLSVAEGMALVRRGMYAFQVDTGAAYDVISLTYTEDEKCGLAEVELYQLPMQAVPVAERSPYRDIFTIRLRWQREVGIMDRVAKIWVPQKPKCESQRGGYVSVGLTEFLPAIKAFVYGAVLAFGIFLAEIGVHYRCDKVKEVIRRRKVDKQKWKD